MLSGNDIKAFYLPKFSGEAIIYYNLA